MLVLVLGACSPPSTTSEEGKAAPRAVAPTPAPAACQEPEPGPPRSWASFPGGDCGFELRDDGDALVLQALTRDAGTAPRGEAPKPCRERTCAYEGIASEVGPLVLAVVPSFDSEMPESVWLGLVAGDQLRFVDLWEGAGESVVTDNTRVGPAHALTPHVCGDRLALLAVERLEAARGLPPPDSLRAREGLLDPTDPLAPPSPVEPDSCRPVGLPVP